MGLLADPHRVDSPDYRPPGQRGSAQLAPVEMTVGGLNEAQLAAKAAQARQAASAKTTDNDVVNQVFELAKTVREAQVAHNESVEQRREDLRLDPEMAMSQRLAFSESESAQSLSVAGRLVDGWLDSKRRAAQAIRDDLIQPGSTEVELRRDRAWRAAQHAIDVAQDDPSGKSTISVARQIIANANDESLGVMVDQVPSYLESLGLPTEFIESEIAARVPALAAANSDLANAERDSAVCRHDISSVQRGIDSGIPVPVNVLVDPAAVEHRIGDVGA